MINIEVSRFSNLNTGKKQITTAKTTKNAKTIKKEPKPNKCKIKNKVKKSTKINKNDKNDKSKIKKTSKFEPKRSKSVEGFKKRRHRVEKAEKLDEPGNIISLSIMPDTMDSKTVFAKSVMSENQCMSDQERANYDVLSNPDIQIKLDGKFGAISKQINSKSRSNLIDTTKKIIKTTKKKSAKKGKLTQRTKITEQKTKLNKYNANPAVGEYMIDSKENRPLQVNSMSSSRINRFYNIQKKIHIDEHLIEELQSS